MRSTDYTNLRKLWASTIEEEWIDAREHYWEIESVKKSVCLERRLSIPGYVVCRIHDDFKIFLIDEFILWKYTDCRWNSDKEGRLSTWECADEYGKKILSYSEKLKNASSIDERTLHEGISLKNGIYGVGVAGITGLLSLLNPEHFGTVDRYVSNSLVAMGEVLVKNPGDIMIDEAVEMEKIMNKKATDLNRVFDTCTWNPRMIDMVLWSYGR